jgi:signal transduction histidine kinase
MSKELRLFLGQVEDEITRVRSLGPINKSGVTSVEVISAKLEHLKLFLNESQWISRLATARMVDSVAEQQRFVQVSVSDEGPGLPPGSEKKIFEKFHQLEKSHAKKGYGLGLTICKMLIELHGGTIGAQSLDQKGSRFFFSVPRLKA